MHSCIYHRFEILVMAFLNQYIYIYFSLSLYAQNLYGKYYPAPSHSTLQYTYSVQQLLLQLLGSIV